MAHFIDGTHVDDCNPLLHILPGSKYEDCMIEKVLYRVTWAEDFDLKDDSMEIEVEFLEHNTMTGETHVILGSEVTFRGLKGFQAAHSSLEKETERPISVVLKAEHKYWGYIKGSLDGKKDLTIKLSIDAYVTLSYPNRDEYGL